MLANYDKLFSTLCLVAYSDPYPHVRGSSCTAEGRLAKTLMRTQHSELIFRRTQINVFANLFCQANFSTFLVLPCPPPWLWHLIPFRAGIFLSNLQIPTFRIPTFAYYQRCHAVYNVVQWVLSFISNTEQYIILKCQVLISQNNLCTPIHGSFPHCSALSFSFVPLCSHLYRNALNLVVL